MTTLSRPGPTTHLDDPGFELDLVLGQYATQIEANSAAIAAHAAAADPHTVYTTTSEATTIANAAVSTHAAAADPHPAYTTAAEVASLAPAETTTTVAALIAGATLKTGIADLDTFGYVDSVGGQVVKVSFVGLKAAIGSTGGTVASTGITDSTAAGRAMLTAADVPAQRGLLGMGTAALQPTTAFAAMVHTHVTGDISGLGSAALSPSTAFAAATHTHVTADITGFSAAALAAAPAETSATIGSLIAGATAKSTPAGADMLLLSDSAAGNAGKKITVAELQTAIGGGGGGSYDAKAAGLPIPVFSVGVPFVLLAGNGSTAGLQFTGSLGAFTMSAAIITNGYIFLDGFYAYLPANFGGQTIAAGWYWAKLTSDTAGVLYQDTYTSGQPVRPASPTPFAVNLTGWLTQTNSEITGPNGFTLPAAALGKNGYMEHMLAVMATASGGTKTARVKAGGTTIASYISPGSNYQDVLLYTRAQGTQSKQKNSRANGVDAGATGTAVASVEYTSLDLSTSKAITVTLQNSAIGESFALLAIACRSTYMA